MKKITLLDHEQIVHKVKYSNKSTFISFLLFILFTVIYDYLNKIEYLSIVAFLFMFIFVVPTLFKILFNLYHRIFQRIYITNERIIIVNGYFLKIFKIFYIKDITGVFYKAKKFDNVNNSSSVKVTFKNNKKIVFKKVTYGIQIAKLLSVNLNKDNK
ncbi:MAG: hypothetical protein K0Q49_1835 [Haloplasmataceae bacterium]|nr:hypothetical protein [Haloplasmataceae bacterium]